MDDYIQSLIDDIIKAGKRASSMNRNNHEDINLTHYTDPLFIEEHKRPLSEYVGFDPSEFPHQDLLSDIQMERIVEALFHLFLAHGVSLFLPEDLPYREQYRFYIIALDEVLYINYQDSIGIEFCEYHPDSCPFGSEQCSCQPFFENIESEEDQQFRYMLKRLAIDEIPITSRYTEQLIGDIHEIFSTFGEEGLLLDLDFFIPDFDDPPVTDLKKPIFEWLGIDLKIFPPVDKLTPNDALAIADTLLYYWDDDNPPILLMNRIEDSQAKYNLAIDMFSGEVGYDGFTCFYLGEPSRKKLQSVLDGFPDLKDKLSAYFNTDGFFDE